MRTAIQSLVFATLVVTTGAAQGQMYKCVDERGKVSYQEHPCAGARSVAPPKPAPGPAAVPASTAPVNAASWREDEAELTWCAEEWRSESTSRDEGRRWEAEQKAAGRGGVPEKFRQTRDQNIMVRFLGKCQKFGFGWPPILAQDAAGEARNDKVAEDLFRKASDVRRARDQAIDRQQKSREAEGSSRR